MRAGAEMSPVDNGHAAAASSPAAEDVSGHGLCREPGLAGIVV